MSDVAPPEGGLYLRRPRSDAGRRIMVGFDHRGVEVLRFIVPDGPVNWRELRYVAEGLLALHHPRLKLA